MEEYSCEDAEVIVGEVAQVARVQFHCKEANENRICDEVFARNITIGEDLEIRQ